MEKLPHYSGSGAQEELLQRLCTEAEQELSGAGNLEDALEIRHQLCSRLQEECSSSLIVNATKAYVDQIIAARWSRNGPGNDLPNH